MTVGCGTDRVILVVDLTGEKVELSERLGDCDLRYVLAGGGGWGYGDFQLDPLSLDYLTRALNEIDDALTRGSAWLALVDAMLDARLGPERLFDTLTQALARESDEQLANAMLGDLSTVWWRFFTPSMRQERAAQLEAELRQGLERAESPSFKAAWFRHLRSLAITPETVSWLRAVWLQEQDVPGLVMAESDYTALAQELAVREVSGWLDILDTQLERIQNPDRRLRFQFVRPVLSSDREERLRWFLALRQLEARRHEPWVIEGLRYLHHPLRADTSAALVRPALEMLVEIQKTGDIFFPTRWLGATLNGHGSPQVAATVQAFLVEQTNGYPPRLSELILQNADILFRAARTRAFQD